MSNGNDDIMHMWHLVAETNFESSVVRVSQTRCNTWRGLLCHALIPAVSPRYLDIGDYAA